MAQGIENWIDYAFLVPFIRSAFIALIGVPLLWMLTKITKKYLKKHVTLHLSVVITKIIFYIGLIFIISTILTTLGFQLTALLGAAGVMGIAIGFAARTSVSNILSGIFLLFEQSFAIGDVLEYGSMSGIVQSINLFSVQLRTFNGKLIRIPNESILQNTIINSSYFHNRRIAIQVTVSKHEYSAELHAQILQIVKNHPHVLSDPKPTVFIESVNYFSIVLYVWAWVEKQHIPHVTQELISQLSRAAHEQKYMVAIQHI